MSALSGAFPQRIVFGKAASHADGSYRQTFSRKRSDCSLKGFQMPAVDEGSTGFTAGVWIVSPGVV